MPAAPITPLEMAKRLIEFDTVSAGSNMALIDFVRDYLAGHGIGSHLVGNADGSKANLFATIGPEEDGGIVLSGHTDVVPVAGQDWSSDPFAPEVRDGRLYGRGAADMKSFIATALALVPEIAAAGLATPVHLALSYDEEVGCLGAPDMIALLGERLPRPRLAIIGEPTGMQVANAHKGVYVFRTEVSGREAHSSASHLGVSANVHAAAIVGRLARIAEARRSAGPADPAFAPPYTTINIGLMEGGTAINIIPRHCRFVWEIRPVPGDDPDAIAAEVERYIESEVLPAMRAGHAHGDDDGLGVATETLARVPPLRPEAGSPAETLALRLAGANHTTTVSFASEAGQFQRAGVPAVLCGPGWVEQAHQPDEFIALEQIDACEAFLRRLIDQLGAEARRQ